jgi:hypothetical protein
MNYNQFSNSFSSNFANNPLLQRNPTSFSQTWNPYSGRMEQRTGYGTRGLSPANAAASQQQEFGRISSLQGLQTGAFNLSEQMRQSEESKRQFEESKQMEEARRRLFEESSPSFKMYQTSTGPQWKSEFDSGKKYIDPFYLDRAKREKELEDLQLGKLRMESGVGGQMFSAFSGGGSGMGSGMGSQSTFGRSWSVPSFPSQGGMG